MRTTRALALALTLALGATPGIAQDDSESPLPIRTLDFAQFEEALASLGAERIASLDELVLEATFDELQAAMESGDLTSFELTTYYLARIHELDVEGLRSMSELNQDALLIAAERDAERADGEVRSPLHGIPISLKDNIGTGDAMHNTAGAAALEGARSDRDAFVVARLRDAGAVIIGKANLSEWANFMNLPGQSGFSALGGQVLNVYDPTQSPLGSSAGSAVGTSANLVAASVGTETAGSIIAPATVAGVVGYKPSRGLVSRDRIIPITDQTDTPGPITRTVADAAALLTAMIGEDPNDPVTSSGTALTDTDFAAFLDANALDGKRVGFYTGGAQLEGMTDEDYIEFIGFTEAFSGLAAAGAEVSLIWGDPLDIQAEFLELGVVGMRDGVAAYLAQTDPDGTTTSMADVVAFNEQDLERFAPYGQNLLEAAVAAGPVSREDYEAAGAQLRDQAAAYVDALFTDNEIDVLVSSGNRLSSAYAVAGYPAITVPAGRSDSRGTLGLTFTGRHLEDGQIIGYAYAYEQASQLRELPPAVPR